MASYRITFRTRTNVVARYSPDKLLIPDALLAKSSALGTAREQGNICGHHWSAESTLQIVKYASGQVLKNARLTDS